MKLLEIIRNKTFWFIDYLHGGNIKKNLKILERLEGSSISEEEVVTFQSEKLQEILEHASKTVPFYSTIKSNEIKDWPIVDKLLIRNNYEKFLSSKYKKDELIVMSTSGSTGTPFNSYQDIEKKRSVNAETIFYNGLIGYTVGRRIIYLRSLVTETKKNVFQQFCQNIYLLDCKDLSDRGIEHMLSLIKKYSKKNGALLMGYSSTFDIFRSYFERNGFSKAEGSNIYGIIGGSTILYDETRHAMESAFKCQCVSRYANEENGFLGQDDEINNTFITNRADYYIEILEIESDKRAQDGEVGRIVVTDLKNKSMPLIRYDTGDIGAWKTIVTRYGKRAALGSFSGRKVDIIFDAENKIVSPHSISTSMWKWKQIEQYQFAQIGHGKYEIRIVLKDESLNKDELIKDLKNVVGINAEICVRLVNNIMVLNSGKRRYIVNELIKNQ